MSSFVLKNEFDFNITHSKNSHLAFMWFIFSLKQPCKCVALFSSFIQKALWESGHRFSNYLWFVYLSTPHKWERKQKCLFFLMGTSKEWKEVTARQFAPSEGVTGNCICFSSVGQCIDRICQWNNVAHLYWMYSVELKPLYGCSH